MLLKFLKNQHWLINLVIKSISLIPTEVIHNISKTIFLKKVFFISNFEKVEGDYVEFGVYEGSSLLAAYSSNKSNNKNNFHQKKKSMKRNFFGFDNFETGFVTLSDKDKHPQWSDGSLNSDYKKTIKRLKKFTGGKITGSKVITKHGDIELIKGNVEDTIPNLDKNKIKQISVVLFDLDLGEPTSICLEFIKDKLSNGSILIFDDYYGFKGSEELGERYAFKKFCEKNPELKFREYKDYGIDGKSFILTL